MAQRVHMCSAGGMTSPAHLPSQQLNRLATQLSQCISDIEFAYLSRPICVDLSLCEICRLVYMDSKGFSFESMMHLARHSAPTLQYLDLYLLRNNVMIGLIQNAHGSYVQYPCLHTEAWIQAAYGFFKGACLSRRTALPPSSVSESHICESHWR